MVSSELPEILGMSDRVLAHERRPRRRRIPHPGPDAGTRAGRRPEHRTAAARRLNAMKQTLASSYAEPRPRPRASPAPALRPPQAAGDGAGPGADLAVFLAPDRRHLPAPQQHLQPVPADVGHRHAGLRHGAGHHRRRDRPVSGIAAGPAGPGRHPDGEPGLEHLAGGGRRAGRRRRVGPGQRLPHDAAARAVLHRRPGRHAGLSRTAAAEHGQRHHRPRARRSGRHRPGLRRRRCPG